MAKGKSTKSGKLQSASSSKRNASASGNGRSSAPAKTRATGQGELSAAEIGKVAGQVWACLSEDGEQTLAAIKKSVNVPADLVVAAIGWLAREDKLDFTTSGRALKVSLR